MIALAFLLGLIAGCVGLTWWAVTSNQAQGNICARGECDKCDCD